MSSSSYAIDEFLNIQHYTKPAQGQLASHQNYYKRARRAHTGAGYEAYWLLAHFSNLKEIDTAGAVILQEETSDEILGSRSLPTFDKRVVTSNQSQFTDILLVLLHTFVTTSLALTAQSQLYSWMTSDVKTTSFPSLRHVIQLSEDWFTQ
ncbi:hypothetical protein AOQ84DRAFT_368755 [Glonium stellatum]|uniref:Uncharacterized protein n=1 Tax=Glonium stellatum TaxID=574774 RepID=A0A8E2JMT6_9PEZI|nr:hypothetical protein AOQ84DRAFT_368755 [Glonium stellatum]